ncbi:replication stress response regulator SDE2-like [Pyrus x bretschneideri]|uniref:replication stress response regulator SDE2-like n=1 Tax=Pyrus x bretschneideri TaxID=225117 RepID=UPI00202FB120|nr:replication stress response regulator SDE2-like [Pyrus x bretschneideri]
MAESTVTKSNTYNLFVNLLEGKTLTLKFTTPEIPATSLKHLLYKFTKIPLQHQRLVTGTRQLEEDSVLSCSSSHAPDFPTVHLLLRLAGGKGGFGSLLRGAATKAGQKKTSNFDACRDMSGRRLRHVNAEKKLEEWRAEEEERILEKMAEDYLKGVAKKGKRGTGDDLAEKYVAKYREQSERCISEVLDSVKEAVKGKRKGPAKEAVEDSKRLKIWMGKRKVGESDSEDDDSDNEDTMEKSVVLNNGNNSDSSKETGRSLDSVTGRKQDGEISSGGSSDSGSEEEKEMVVRGPQAFGGCRGQASLDIEKNEMVGPVISEGKIVWSASVTCSDPDVVSGAEAEQDRKIGCSGPEMGNLEKVVGQSEKVSSSGHGQEIESASLVAEANGSSESNPEVREETVASGNTAVMEKPLNFDEYNSAAEMEVLGRERLKSELQTRGLKCGGTLQEQAARLFMLKTTPIEKIPKKLLAKK